MNPNHFQNFQSFVSATVAWLRTAFDATATWVTQLSWRKFLLIAILMIFVGALIQDILFGGKSERSVVVHKNQPGAHSKLFRTNKQHEITTDDGTTIRIDGTGLHITSNPNDKNKDGGQSVGTPDAAGAPAVAQTTGETAVPAAPAAPAAPAVPQAETAKSSSDLHIYLPPEVGQEVRDALADAVDEAASQEITVAQKKSSEWFMNFVLLLVLGLFGTKALMGGKKRAEAQAQAANAAAERATLQREITEAKMQVMQAQVEPHFLFNTLASVEYLIETDPPRASAMQRSLIQYLRAVLPQMRDPAKTTTLGREADMVRAYLDLLKMRMEERLTVDFQIPAGLRSAVFPPMMLQSLVENAIKHGLERKAEGGTLQVLAEIADNRLRVTVADDGLGFGAMPSDGTGLGLQSIRERLTLLYQNQGYLEIVPNQPTGVRSTIEVPYQIATNGTAGSSTAK